MKTEGVYIDLFAHNRPLLNKGCAPLLKGEREQALQCFIKHGFPEHTEEYLHSDIQQWTGIDWGMDLARKTVPKQVSERSVCTIPGMGTYLFGMVNGAFGSEWECNAKSLDSMPQGVVAGSLNRIAAETPDLIKPYYNKLAVMDRAGCAAFNALFVQDGFVLYVPDGVTIDKPIQLVVSQSCAVPMLVNRRILVVLGKGASATLLVCDHSQTQTESMSVLVTEVFVGQGASLQLFDLEQTHRNNVRLSELYIKQEQDSRVYYGGFTLMNGKSRNSVYTILNGRGASASVDGAAIEDGNQHADYYTFVEHRESDCTSNELFKYVLDGDSTGNFYGRVLVKPDAQRTVSEQTNRNVCMSDTARMFAQPQLEIYADDVKCSHGATVGQLDDAALFYMRQRGIPEAQARLLLMLAFVNEVIDRISVEALRERLRHLIEQRFRGELTQCSGCKACK